MLSDFSESVLTIVEYIFTVKKNMSLISFNILHDIWS